MLENIDTGNILFLDIETVPMKSEYKELPDNFKKLWDRKALSLKAKEDDTPDQLYERAGIFAEFGKIICISVGYVSGVTLKIKSFYSDDEKLLLKEFTEMLDKHYSNARSILCGHNAKEFDYPYLSRRILINGLSLPSILDISGKKPWEVGHLDTMQLWKFGDYKSYTSLALLTALFNIPTPKDDIEGSDVARVYWKDHDLERIVKYCQKDVIAVVQLFLRFQGKPLIKDENIIITEK
jgi:3'-5' exonuclease